MIHSFRFLNKNNNDGFTFLESAVASLMLASLSLCLLLFTSSFLKSAESGKLSTQNANTIVFATETLRKTMANIKPPYWHGAFTAEILETSVTLNFTGGDPKTITTVRNTSSGIDIQCGDQVINFSNCSFTAKPIVSGNILVGIEFILKLPKAHTVQVLTAFGSFIMKEFYETK